MKKTVGLCIVLAVVLAACGGGAGGPPPYVPKTTVYLAGYTGSVFSPNACYWVDGVRTALSVPDGIAYSYAYAIAVEDGKVYIAGAYNDSADAYISNNNNKACYWVDGVFKDLHTEGDTPSYANSISVDGGTVYIAGSCSFAKYCYWVVGGSRTDLTLSGTFTSVDAIAVSGGTIYAAGYNYDIDVDYKACYWVDGACTDLPVPDNVTESRARAIAVYGGKVYVAGSYTYDGFYRKACYWVDGAFKDLNGSSPTSNTYAIAVSGGTVYTAGYYDDGDTRACYWVNNGAPAILPAPTLWSGATAIAVSDGTVYTAGYYSIGASDNKACYWIGNTLKDLNVEGWVNGIAVVTK